MNDGFGQQHMLNGRSVNLREQTLFKNCWKKWKHNKNLFIIKIMKNHTCFAQAYGAY